MSFFLSFSFLPRFLSEKTTNTSETSSDSSKGENKCEMFGAFGFLVQAILGVVAFSVLIIKRFVEKPRRAWKIWFYDICKQIISSVLLHLFNLLVSAIFSKDEEEADACVWYFVTVFLDCTLGAFLSYIFMWLVDGIAKSSDWKVLKTGLYYEEYKKGDKTIYKLVWKKYLSQLAVWLVITVLCKIVLIIMLKICRKFMINMGGFVLAPFTNGKVRLVMVMIVFPLILNALYFWCVDNILKFKPDEDEKEKIHVRIGVDGKVRALGEEVENDVNNNRQNVELGQLKDRNINNNDDYKREKIDMNEIKLDVDSKE